MFSTDLMCSRPTAQTVFRKPQPAVVAVVSPLSEGDELPASDELPRDTRSTRKLRGGGIHRRVGIRTIARTSVGGEQNPPYFSRTVSVIISVCVVICTGPALLEDRLLERKRPKSTTGRRLRTGQYQCAGRKRPTLRNASETTRYSNSSRALLRKQRTAADRLAALTVLRRRRAANSAARLGRILRSHYEIYCCPL
jgi:hypothetical protein